MLQRIQAEVTRYERVITYWPSFGPSLEAAVCAALRTTTAAVSRQCGLMPVLDVSIVLRNTHYRNALPALRLGAVLVWLLMSC